jgi:predicted lipoprotein with Yx(FWY)xxD motif
MSKANQLARSIAAAVGAVALLGFGSASATTPPTEPPGDTAMSADTSATGDTSMSSDTAMGGGAGPSDCPPVTEEASEGTEMPSASEAPAGTEASEASAAPSGTDATMATEAMGTEAPMATEAPGATMAEGSVPAVEGPFVQIVETDEYGPILADSQCHTLYGFTNDTDGESTCFDDCAATWPPLFVPDDSVPPLADELDPSLFSVVEHPEGSMLKIGDWPLYLFGPDTAPGDINGQGVGGVWWVVAPDGTLIETDEGETEGTTAGSEAPAGSEPAASAPSGTEASATTSG